MAVSSLLLAIHDWKGDLFKNSFIRVPMTALQVLQLMNLSIVESVNHFNNSLALKVSNCGKCAIAQNDERFILSWNDAVNLKAFFFCLVMNQLSLKVDVFICITVFSQS